MNKREFERINSSLVVKFLRNESCCYGIVTDISERGMCIRSGHCLPLDSKIKLQIPLGEKHLEIPVTVKRVVKTSDFYDTMGVELLRPTKKYLQIVDNLKERLETA